MTCAASHCRVYSEHYSAYAGVHQPDPPGLIHDDLRLLPPGGGRPLLGVDSPARRTPISSPLVCATTSQRMFIHKFFCVAGDAASPSRHGGPMTLRAPTASSPWLAEPALRDVGPCRGSSRCPRCPRSNVLPVSRKAWSAAAAIVLDEAAAVESGRSGLPRRPHVLVLTGSDPAPATWAAAIEAGARQVLRSPSQEHELVRALADAGESARDGWRSRCGGGGYRRARGAGASLFATALRALAADALLVDLDPGAAASICRSAPSGPGCAGQTSGIPGRAADGLRCAKPCRGIVDHGVVGYTPRLATSTPMRCTALSMPAGAVG